MKKRLLKIVCLLSAVSLLLTGCWEEPDMDASVRPTETEEPEETRVILPAVFTLPYDPDETLDPITCSGGMQQVVSSLLYEGLFRLDRELQPQPCLCRSFTYDASSLTYTLTLRSGVTFSDGSPLTAEDVTAALWRAKASPRYGARLAKVSGLTAGDGTVTVTLSAPDTGLPALLDIPIVKAGSESGLVPVGTGPYVLTDGEDGACLTARADWWGGEGQPAERIALSAAGDRDAMLYQFSSHAVQLITADLVGTAPIPATGNISYADADTAILHYVGFNTLREPFRDAAVRRALGLGLDRDTLVSAVLSGHGRGTQAPVNPVSPLYPEEADVLYSYDSFAGAMEAAGLTAGQPRTVTLLVNQENSFKVAAAEHIAEALSDFDLQLQVEVLPWADYTAALAAGDFDLYYGEVKLPANWDLTALVGTGGAVNYGGWADARTDQLLAAYASASDRAGALAALCGYLAEQAPILPVCFTASSVLYQTGVVEGLTPTAAEPFYDLSSCRIHLRAS